MATGQLFYDPVARPLSSLGVSMPGAFYNFYVSGTTTPATVFQDAAQTLPYPAASLNGSSPLFSLVQADGTGAMPTIFLNPQTIYRVQLYSSTWSLIEDVDPYVPSMPVTGNGQIILNAQGEVVVSAPIPGGTGVALTVNARAGGAAALGIVGSGAGSPALIANMSVVAGAQTATFAATNKPGAGTTAPTKWLPITCDGAIYYLPLWQ
jgi:hypothetical protein